MKICDISSFYSDLGGGVRTYHHQKLAYFSRHPEHEYVMVIAGPRNEVEDVEGGRIYRIRGVPVSRKGGYRQIADIFAVKRLLEEEQPDVIEIGSAYLDCWLALASRTHWAPVYSGFYHADFPDSYMAPAVSGFPRAISRPFVNFWKKYVRFTYEQFDVTCVTSRYIEKKLKEFGVRNTYLVPLGVDSELFSPDKRSEEFRRKIGIGSNQKLGLYVGRFWSEKGIDVLAASIGRLAEREDLQIVLVGDGNLEADIRAAAAHHPRVHIMGYVMDREELAQIYASADLFFSPGPYETFGLSTVEALSSGVPVVAAGSGGAGETVAASGAGMLFKPHDADDFICRVDRMLNENLEVLGRKARQFVENNLSWEKTFQRMVNHYGALRREKLASLALTSRCNTGTGFADPTGPLPAPILGGLSTASLASSAQSSPPMASF